MPQKARIQKELREAFKQKNAIKTSTLRMLLTAINNAEIRLKKKETGLSEEEEQKAIKSEAKKRIDAAEAYNQANRPEAAQKEKEELEIIKTYLPEESSDEQTKEAVKKAIGKVGASSMKDFGLVMKETMILTGGRANGKKAGEAAKKLLD